MHKNNNAREMDYLIHWNELGLRLLSMISCGDLTPTLMLLIVYNEETHFMIHRK